MKTYKHPSSVHSTVRRTTLKYVEYDVVKTNGKFTAVFVCLSDLEKAAVVKNGFTYKT